MEGFIYHQSPTLCYVTFILTAFISQITILNMLIAIMADTFERVIDQRPTFQQRNKLMILASMSRRIRLKSKEDDS